MKLDRLVLLYWGGASYGIARKNGWMEECTKHMKKTKNKAIIRSDGIIYKSVIQAAADLNISTSQIYVSLKEIGFSTGGYFFKYVK